MFIGGTLIRRFDGFRRLCRRAALDFNLPLSLPDTDLLLANRVLAGMGGPPAASEVRGRFEGDGLPLLLLFLLAQEIPCRIGLLGSAEPVLGRLKGLVHLLGHAACPMVTGHGALSFQEVVRELGTRSAILRPCVHYDEEGEPESIEPSGAAGVLRVGSDGGPYTLAVLLGSAAGPAPLDSGAHGLHATVLIVSDAN